MLRLEYDLDLIRVIINMIEADRMRDRERDHHIEKIAQQSKQAEESCNQLGDRVSSLESVVLGLSHQVGRAVELEYMDHPFSLDGQARCNYED